MDNLIDTVDQGGTKESTDLRKKHYTVKSPGRKVQCPA